MHKNGFDTNAVLGGWQWWIFKELPFPYMASKLVYVSHCMYSNFIIVVSNTRKFNRGLSTLLHDKLHWLDVPERVTFKLGLMTYRCLHGQAPRYLADHIKPAIEVASRHRLRSANRHRLIVPRCRLNTYGRRAFPVAGPTIWNSLPDELRDPACDIDSFKQFFKTILFSQY